MKFRPSRWAACAAISALFCCVSEARAQMELGALTRAFDQTARATRSIGSLPGAFATGRGGRIPVVVRAARGFLATDPRLVLHGDFAVAETFPDELATLLRAHPDWSFDWAPPRRLLLDQVDGWVRASSTRAETGLSGSGVVVAFIDSGVELTHPDLCAADGTTRVRWLIDFSREPAGTHADLEAQYGCADAMLQCAVYAQDDLKALIGNAVIGDEPSDSVGHGTQRAWVAAGNGLGSQPVKYVGIAPEASLIVGRVTRDNGSISDPEILTAVKFAFDRAAELGMPAVVNLSLGGDFGAHDGTSALEEELARFVGPNFPGRAIVVSAGNSAGLISNLSLRYPGPFGIHTEVHVPRASVSRVPLVVPASAQTSTQGSVFVWLGFRAGDDVSVRVDDKDGELVPGLPVGSATTQARSGIRATLSNGTPATDRIDGPGANNAVLILDGAFQGEMDFEIVLEGHGTAELWAESAGGLGPELGNAAMFARGEKQGTINIPASHPALIAVGATLNRTSWRDVSGKLEEFPAFGSLANAPLDTIAFFSAAGPNALGMMKPDIVAPGAYVAGAMAQIADPRATGGAGLFGAGPGCTNNDCFVVDERHAIASGTSMSAPIVAGAVALLFERDPTLTLDAVRALLQAGARPLEGVIFEEQQVGPGALDLAGVLAVELAEDSPVLREPGSASWLALSASYAHPDPTWPLAGYVELRDNAGQVADGFDPTRLRLVAEPATITEPLTRLAPGLYRFSVTAPAGTGGQTLSLSVLFDEKPLLARQVPIAVDRWVAQGGVSARGGCAISALGEDAAGPALALGILAVTFCVRRRRESALHAR